MHFDRSFFVSMLAAAGVWFASSALPSIASAQVVVQGEVTVQGQPTVYVAPAAPAAYGQPAVVQPVVAQPYVAQPQACPQGASLMPNRWGQPTCMVPVEAHRVSGGLLGGGIGLLAGGYVIEVFTTLFSGIVGAFGTDGTTYTASDLDKYVTWGLIPVLGPWVQMGYAPPFADGSLYAWLAFEGLLQAGGITMMVFGIMGEDYTDYRPVAGLDLHVRPVLGMTNGVDVTYRF